MDILAEARRRAFSLWLRTERIPRWAKPANPEVKFNPWHDPADGRFTYTGRGRYFGQGSTDGPVARMHERPPRRGKRSEPFGGFGGGGQGFTGGGASGSWDAPEPNPTRNRDAERSTSQSVDRTPQAAPQASTRPVRNPIDNPRSWRRVERNGYGYRIDALGRTRRVSGVLVENQAQPRSRTAQSNAGVPDRRSGDHGGHYIARRFNGPTDAFNHFAQDAKFNRGGYRALENQWARAMRAGKRVEVKIEPIYEGSSRRPTTINVSFWIDGVKRRVRFPNESRERSDAKR